MKKTLFVALLACFTLMFASCNKEENPNMGREQEQNEEKELAGTSWVTHTVMSEDVSDEEFEGTMNLIIDGTLKFVDATKGTITVGMSATVTTGGQTFPFPYFDEEPATSDFTYTFDGEKGTLTATDDDGETETIAFTYDKKENTIKISETEVDEETGESTTYEMVFTEVR